MFCTYPQDKKNADFFKLSFYFFELLFECLIFNFAPKRWLKVFRPAFGVCSTQRLVKIYNTRVQILMGEKKFPLLFLRHNLRIAIYLPSWLIHELIYHVGLSRLDSNIESKSSNNTHSNIFKINFYLFPV